MRHFLISDHAVDRWIERVAKVSRAEARLTIRAFMAQGKAAETPRWWMKRVPEPGDLYIYCSKRRGVCLVLAASGAITTVYTQEASRQYRHLKLVPPPSPATARDTAHLRWRIGGAGSAADFGDDGLLAS